jgi:hypothetical protein
MKRSLAAAAGLVCILSAPFCPAQGATVVPVGDFRFLGGQYFFNSNASSLSGNLSFTVAPAIKFSDRFTLIPTYMGAYRGTKEVADLAGGGTLFQDGQDHFLSVKGVYAVLPPLKLKLGASYRAEYLRETKDENWGAGLFDYRKINTGFEAEYAYMRGGAVRAGVDYFTLRFPNYRSLESSMGDDLGRELAGADTLDCNNLMSTLKLNNTFGRLTTELAWSMTAKDYPDQPLVLADSTLADEKRTDAYSIASANLTCPVRAGRSLRIIAALDAQYVRNDSNQAHYDAQKPLFIADYYDYTSLAAGPTFHFVMGKSPWAVSIGGSMNRQEYVRRPVQDASGNYRLDEKISVDETVVSVGITYPVSRSFKLRLVSNFIDSRSNMEYEKTYAYNYQTANYLMGFSYEF